MRKLIVDMTYIELDEFLKQDIKFTDKQFMQIKKHKNVTDWHFWGKGEWTIEIVKDNGNLYSDVDIFIKEK